MQAWSGEGADKGWVCGKREGGGGGVLTVREVLLSFLSVHSLVFHTVSRKPNLPSQ